MGGSVQLTFAPDGSYHFEVKCRLDNEKDETALGAFSASIQQQPIQKSTSVVHDPLAEGYSSKASVKTSHFNDD